MTNVTVTTIGDSVGIVLPQEVLDRLQVEVGDLLCVTETPRGLELTHYDKEFAKQVDVAENVMREDRDVLRKLAE